MNPSPISYESIFSIKSDEDFNRVALAVFQYQAKNNEVYKNYLNLLKCDLNSVVHYNDIPFLPISFFKTHQVITGKHKLETTFFSSGTTGQIKSKHQLIDTEIYNLSLLFSFELHFGPVSDYVFLSLLPSYHENESSSLLYMVDSLMNASGNYGGYYLDNLNQLVNDIKTYQKLHKVVLIGVSYALLDLAELGVDLNDVIVIETGGMKGKRKELTKPELHTILKKGLNVKSIGSEYGMTELLSQAWSKGGGLFNTPPWMKILIRDYTDPFNWVNNKSGGINVIDLANVHSCSFIETQDLGKLVDNQFEVLGRFDYADIRGCNLLIQ